MVAGTGLAPDRCDDNPVGQRFDAGKNNDPIVLAWEVKQPPVYVRS